MNLQNIFAERLALFRDSFSEEETDTFLRSLVTVGDIVEAGFGADVAAKAMRSLYHLLVGSELEGEQNWREAFEDLTSSSEIALTSAMERGGDLNAFAYFGVLASWDLSEPLPPELAMSRSDVPGYIRSVIADYENFMSLFGAAAPTWGFDVISRTILAARGRLAIDENRPMTVHELAALSGVAPKRVQNAIYAKSDQAPVVDDSGLVTPASARQWLDARGYLPSIWRDWSGVEHFEGAARVESEDEEDDFLFVPEASDGSLFSPNGCARGSGDDRHYTIGEKGAERTVPTYEGALEELTRMVTPRWRRPNSSGNWGVVRAERWRRIPRSDLDRL
jgi:hypothetical protein